MTRVLVAGVGNRWRGDDAVGPLVARSVRGLLGDDVRVVEVETEPTRLLDAWEGVEATVVVDAVRSGAAPGTLVRVDAAAGPLPASLAPGSTHHVGLAETIELARRLGRLPRAAIVLAVEGERFEASGELSAPVERALPGIVRAVEREARRLSAGATAAP